MIVPRFDPDASSEFLAAIQYYEDCRPKLGKRFRDAVKDAVRKVCESPLSYRVVRKPFRKCLVQRFPYSIIYAVERDHILIIAVAHAKRRPGFWHSRTSKHT